jgi:hypothetical protein
MSIPTDRQHHEKKITQCIRRTTKGKVQTRILETERQPHRAHHDRASGRRPPSSMVPRGHQWRDVSWYVMDVLENVKTHDGYFGTRPGRNLRRA